MTGGEKWRMKHPYCPLYSVLSHLFEERRTGWVATFGESHVGRNPQWFFKDLNGLGEILWTY